MKKWVLGIILISLYVFISACQKDEALTYTFDKDIIELYHTDLVRVFGDYHVINKEQITSVPVKSYSQSVTYIYDEWEIEFTNSNQISRSYKINNRLDLPSQIKIIMLDNIKLNILDNLQWKFKDPFIQFENSFEQYDQIETIPNEFYPINLHLSNLPKEFLTILIINIKDIQDYRYNINGLIKDIETLKLYNVLILYEDEAYYMNHGLFIHDQTLINSSITVEDTLKWIDANQ
jgi:hypothetical protein